MRKKKAKTKQKAHGGERGSGTGTGMTMDTHQKNHGILHFVLANSIRMYIISLTYFLGLLFNFLDILLVFVCECSACIYACAPRVYSACRDWKRALDPMALEF